MEKAKSEHEMMTKTTTGRLHPSLLIPIGSARQSCLATWTLSLIRRIDKVKKQLMLLTGFIKKTPK
jgi:hypothetical protein